MINDLSISQSGKHVTNGITPKEHSTRAVILLDDQTMGHTKTITSLMSDASAHLHTTTSNRDDASRLAQIERQESIATSQPVMEQQQQHELLRSILHTVPADFNAVDTVATQFVQDMVTRQDVEKNILHDQLWEGLHANQQHSPTAVNIMLDLCDDLEESTEDCFSTHVALRRCRKSFAVGVRLISLNRRREHLRELKDVLECLVMWQSKVKGVLNDIEQRDYVPVIVLLGAKLYSENGSPLDRKSVV